jgi:hypothetical protein
VLWERLKWLFRITFLSRINGLDRRILRPRFGICTAKLGASYLCGLAEPESLEHLSIVRRACERRPVRQPMSLAGLTQVRDPQPRFWMSARPAAAPAFRAPDRMADVLDLKLVREAVERLDRDLATVIAGRAREQQREPSARSLPSRTGRSGSRLP